MVVSPYEAILFKAVFCLAFFGAFRISELVANSGKSGISGGMQLQHVQVERGHVRVLLARFKTDQQGKEWWVVLKEIADLSTCMVAALREYLQLPPSLVGSLFIHADSRLLMRFQVTAVLQMVLRWIGKDP